MELYSEHELLQVQTMLVSSIHLNRDGLIDKAGISKYFVIRLEAKLERLGHSFI